VLYGVSKEYVLKGNIRLELEGVLPLRNFLVPPVRGVAVFPCSMLGDGSQLKCEGTRAETRFRLSRETGESI